MTFFPIPRIAFLWLPVAAAVVGGGPAWAAQVDLSSYVNANAQTYTQGGNYPTGSTTINGIGFALASYNGGGTGVFQSDNSSIDIAGLNIAGAGVAYTIINSAFGVFGSNVGTITFNGSGGASVTFDLVEGLNVRDHYFGNYNNIATGLYGTAAYSNGTEVPDGPGKVHFDVQRFNLSALMGQNISSISFDGNNPGGGEPFLAAITSGAAVGAVPEPAIWTMMIVGFGLVGGMLRRRQKVVLRFA